MASERRVSLRSSPEREFADGEVIAGTRYRVIGLIGSGGMGSVYEVEHVELGKRFVLKALLRSLASRDDLVRRLRVEWRALGRLEHPSVVSVSDAGVTSGNVPYYVMERLHGETLSARLRRDRRVPVGEALRIAADVLDGLDAAHRLGIVHRDVKPPNIFLVPHQPAKLLDFGIAKILDPSEYQITRSGVAIGTPRYMAPEQASGRAVDARTDLYAVGLVLFEMIAGAGPFDGARDANELFLAHLTREAPSLSRAVPGIPEALGPWVRDLLAKEPGARPADAATVSVALRGIRERGAGGRSSAPPPPLRLGEAETRTIAPVSPAATPRREGGARSPSRTGGQAVAVRAAVVAAGAGLIVIGATQLRAPRGRGAPSEAHAAPASTDGSPGVEPSVQSSEAAPLPSSSGSVTGRHGQPAGSARSPEADPRAPLRRGSGL